VRTQQNFLLTGVYVGKTKTRGRGVFTLNPIAAGTLIEIAPVIVMSGDDRQHLDQTLLHDYIFEWSDDKKNCCMALGLVPVYNHSYTANCEYEMYFKKDLIAVKTVREIGAGEELFINYNGDWNSDKQVWFDTSP
jgi:SET domain-containing protein